MRPTTRRIRLRRTSRRRFEAMKVVRVCAPSPQPSPASGRWGMLCRGNWSRRGARGILATTIAMFAFFAVAASAAAPTWEDPAKVLRVSFPIAETGFDPAPVQDYYSAHILRMVFDPLYVPGYLERPYRPVPDTADGMPEISADGKVWTIHVKKGIYFADDPVFKGKKRETSAHAHLYSWERVVDPKVRSPN